MEQEDVSPEVWDKRVSGMGRVISGPGEREHLVLSVSLPAVARSLPSVAWQRGPLPLGRGPARSSPEAAAGSPWLLSGLHVLISLEGLFLNGTSVATSQRPLFLKQTV